MFCRAMFGMVLVLVGESACRVPSGDFVDKNRPAAGTTEAFTGETDLELRRRAEALLQGGKAQKALVLFDLILVPHPTDAYALYGRAQALALANQKDSAVGCLRQAIDAGFSDFARFATDPGILSLRGVAAFEAILLEYEVVLKEERQPDLAQIKRILAEPRLHRFLPRLLPRYHSGELTGATLPLLESPEPDLQRCAIIALLHQQADRAEIRAKVALRLASPAATLREAAAEYLLWHGIAEDRGGSRPSEGSRITTYWPQAGPPWSASKQEPNGRTRPLPVRRPFRRGRPGRRPCRC